MKTEQILMCIVSLILGILLANMLMDVCGCKKLLEGQSLAEENTVNLACENLLSNVQDSNEKILKNCICNSIQGGENSTDCINAVFDLDVSGDFSFVLSEAGLEDVGLLAAATAAADTMNSCKGALNNWQDLIPIFRTCKGASDTYINNLPVVTKAAEVENEAPTPLKNVIHTTAKVNQQLNDPLTKVTTTAVNTAMPTATTAATMVGRSSQGLEPVVDPALRGANAVQRSGSSAVNTIAGVPKDLATDLSPLGSRMETHTERDYFHLEKFLGFK